MTGFRTSIGNSNKMRVPVAHSFQKRPYLASPIQLLTASIRLIRFPCLFKAFWIMCLLNNRDLDTWYDTVYALPIAWPDVTDINTHYFKKISANLLLALRTQLGAVFVVLCCFFFGLLVVPFYEHGMHKYVVISKTVTIVTMSAAMEQNVFATTCDALFLAYLLFLTQRGAVTMIILTVPWYRTHSNGAKKK